MHPKMEYLPNGSITPFLQSSLAAEQLHDFCAQRNKSLRNLDTSVKTAAGSFRCLQAEHSPAPLYKCK